MNKGFSVLLAATAMALVPAAASAQELQATAGFNINEGKYGGDSTTTMWSAPVGLRWSDGPLVLSANVPVVSIRTAGVAFAGFDGTPLIMRTSNTGPKRTYTDIGDPTLTASYDLSLPSDVTLRTTGRVKIPLQGSSHVSTGKVDWSLGGELSRPFGRVTPFAAVSYRWFGDTKDWNVRDGFAASAGASVAAGPGAVAVSYEYARSTSTYIRDAHEIVAVYDVPVASRMRLAAFGTAGLSSGASRVGGGVRLSFRL